MKRVSPFIGLLVMVLLASSAPLTSIHAQGDPPTDEQATIDRFVQAVMGISDYQSGDMTSTRVGTAEQTVVDADGGLILSLEQTITVEHHGIRASQEPRNGQAWETVIVYSNDSRTGIVDYTLTAEVREVDGVLYVLAERTPNPDAVTAANADLPPMPEGWTVIEDPNEWPALEYLDLEDYQDGRSMADEIEAFVPFIEAVTVDTATLEDGTPVDVITLTFNKEGVAMLYQVSDDANPIYELLDDESRMDVTIWLDADDIARQHSRIVTAVWHDIDLNVADESIPAGSALFSMSVKLVDDVTMSAVNEPFDPVAAPEMPE